MNLSRLTLPVLGALIIAGASRAADTTVQSGPAHTLLLELFTSEGCSSCPPAERWLSALRQSPRLWKDVVPIAFHVDYWDGLGWPDPLATKAATQRQRAYAAAWASNSIYTPEFVLNGREWSARDLDSLPASGEAGKLSATLRENGEVIVTFKPAGKMTGPFQAHAALLALGLVNDVKAGENSGRRLVHDFAVLSHQSADMAGDAAHESARATLHLPPEKVKHGNTALAVWITGIGRLEPVQAAGGNL